MSLWKRGRPDPMDVKRAEVREAVEEGRIFFGTAKCEVRPPRYDEVVSDHERDTDPRLGDFYLMERRYWVVKCRTCQHQITGPVPQTDKARNMVINQMRDKACNNCKHEAEKNEAMGR